MQARAALLAMLLLGCNPGDLPKDRIENSSLADLMDFTPPPGFRRQDVQGIDTEIHEYRGPGARLLVSWGWYDGVPVCGGSECRQRETRIGGRKATITNFMAAAEPGDEGLRYRWIATFDFGPSSVNGVDNIMNIRGYCQDEAACGSIMKSVSAIRFKR
jgi:hypothetical protein